MECRIRIGECTLKIGEAARQRPSYRCSATGKGFLITLIHSLLHPTRPFEHPSTKKAPLPLVKSVEQTLRRRTPCSCRLAQGSTHTLQFEFFFQAEGGIRDYKVTGVQTCALPI